MKTTALCALLLLSATIFVSCRNQEAEMVVPASETPVAKSALLPDHKSADDTDKNEEVWVCKSNGARRYHHNRNCGGLKRCTHQIEQTSVKDAEAIGLTHCNYNKCR